MYEAQKKWQKKNMKVLSFKVLNEVAENFQTLSKNKKKSQLFKKMVYAEMRERGLNMKFNHIDSLAEELESRGFQSYNLKIGLEDFLIQYTSCIGTDTDKFETFEWLDENEKPICIDIKVKIINTLDENGDYQFEI